MQLVQLSKLKKLKELVYAHVMKLLAVDLTRIERKWNYKMLIKLFVFRP